MESPDLIWSVLLFAGLTQGLFVVVVLLTSRVSDRSSAVLLAALTLVFTLMIGEELIDTAGLYQVLPHVLFSTFSLPLAIGPLLLLSARHLGDPSRQLGPLDLLHFLPLLGLTLYMAPFYLLDGSSKLTSEANELSGSIDVLVLIKGIHVLLYLSAAIFVTGRALEVVDPEALPRVLWFRRLLLVAIVPVVLIHVLYFFPELGPVDSDRGGSLFLAVMIYTFAYGAMKWPLPRTALVERVLPEVESEPPAKYRTSSLDEGTKRSLYDALIAHMEEDQAYLDPETRLDDIASTLGASPHELSQVMNELSGMNFYAFLNGYRLAAVKQMMLDPANDRRTLLALALDAGFNSKTSFNRIFKRDTGSTPSEFRRRQRHGAVGPESAPDPSAT